MELDFFHTDTRYICVDVSLSREDDEPVGRMTVEDKLIGPIMSGPPRFALSWQRGMCTVHRLWRCPARRSRRID